MSKITSLIATKKLLPIRYGFVLDSDLYAEWIEVREQVDELPERDPTTPKSQRANGPEVALRRRAAELEQQVAEVTAIALFRVPSADQMEGLRSGWDAENLTTPQRARAIVLACFVQFEENGEPVEDAGLEDLAALLPNLSQGELYGISTPLANLSNSALDLPKSTRQYIETRNSAMNSKPA